jgi:hypothetical protein
VYVDIFGLEKLTNVHGITSLITGIGVFIGIYLLGHIKSWTGNYIGTFVLAGILLIGSGVLVIFACKVIKKEKQKFQQENSSSRK